MWKNIGKISGYINLTDVCPTNSKIQRFFLLSLSDVKDISQIILNIVLVISGIIGLLWVIRYREKQRNATFNYLMKLNAHIIIIKNILEQYKYGIVDCLVKSDLRQYESAEQMAIFDELLEKLSSEAEKTLEFFQKEGDQFPAGIGWTEKINKFMSFLYDCIFLKYDNFYKQSWCDIGNINEKQHQYADEHITNIKEIMDMIDSQRLELEKKIFKKYFR